MLLQQVLGRHGFIRLIVNISFIFVLEKFFSIDYSICSSPVQRIFIYNLRGQHSYWSGGDI